jgi:hypothetical protein
MKLILRQLLRFCGEIMVIKPDKDEVKGNTTKKKSDHLNLLKWLKAGGSKRADAEVCNSFAHAVNQQEFPPQSQPSLLILKKYNNNKKKERSEKRYIL